MQINEQIKKFRKAAGLTQEQIANYLGVSTPAVNKWEKGTTFPDVTLLSGLARLLNIDLNTLFGFHETLTDVEIEAFSRELIMLSQESPDKDFKMAVQKIQEYPKSDAMLLSPANILNASLVLTPMETEKKQGYQALVNQWLEQVAVLLEQIPKQQFDKTPYEANILIHQDKLDEAAILLESKLLHSLSSVQTYCLKLLDLEWKCSQPDKARQIGEIIEKMISLFGLWQYGTVVPRLQIALYEKNKERSIALIKEMMEAANAPWILSDSPVFYRIAHETVKNVGKSLIPALISELKTSTEYDFLRDSSAFQEFLKGLDDKHGTN